MRLAHLLPYYNPKRRVRSGIAAEKHAGQYSVQDHGLTCSTVQLECSLLYCELIATTTRYLPCTGRYTDTSLHQDTTCSTTHQTLSLLPCMWRSRLFRMLGDGAGLREQPRGFGQDDAINKVIRSFSSPQFRMLYAAILGAMFQ